MLGQHVSNELLEVVVIVTPTFGDQFHRTQLERFGEAFSINDDLHDKVHSLSAP